jgi:hypothetical protein
VSIEKNKGKSMNFSLGCEKQLLLTRPLSGMTCGTRTFYPCFNPPLSFALNHRETHPISLSEAREVKLSLITKEINRQSAPKLQ